MATSVVLIGLLFWFVAVPGLLLFLAWLAWRPARNAQANPMRRGETPQPKRPGTDPIRRANDEAVRHGEKAAACPECGAALSADSPEGLCPPCLLHHALNIPSPTPTGDHAAFIAPDPADLAPHFPQLQILSLLGQGGMGAVYKARQLKLDRFVAVKILPAEWGRDPAFAERFAREARALARLSHPHIVGVHDFGEAGGHFFLLMEYVDGANLRQLLQAGPLDPRLALQIIPQVCDALQYAHDEGVIHRDVKPENILVDQRGRVKMADFGLAKLVGPSRASFTLTGTHQVMGTLDYMAPEQRNHPQEVDQRADIYSLGVVFYEMLTGNLPLGRFSPPSDAAGVDSRLDEIVHRALEREPHQRYQHVSEVLSALDLVAGERNGAARSPQPTETETVQLQVQGPAAALIASAMVALLFGFVVAASSLLYYIRAVPPGRLGTPAWESTLAFELPAFLTLPGLVLAIVIITGALRLRSFSGYGLIVAAIVLAMLPWSPHCLIGIPAGAWAIWVLNDPKVKAAFAAKLQSRSKSRCLGGSRGDETSSREYVQLQTQGPATALIISAAAAFIHWAIFGFVLAWEPRSVFEPGESIVAPALMWAVAASLALVIARGAVQLKRFDQYSLVIAAIILAMLPWSFHCLIGIPAGIWALWVLKDPTVKAAFAANLRRGRIAPRRATPPQETVPFVRKARSFWGSFYAAFISSPHNSLNDSSERGVSAP